MLPLALPQIDGRVVLGFIGAVFTAAIIGALTDWFRDLPAWVWRLIRRRRTPDDPAKQRVRDEKRERLRPRFEKAVDASEKMREATVFAEWGKTQKSDELMRSADEIFDGMRTQLLTEPEGEEIVALYDKLHNGYLEYRVRLQDRQLLRDALRPDLPEFAQAVRDQRDVVIALAKEVRATIQRTLKSLEP